MNGDGRLTPSFSGRTKEIKGSTLKGGQDKGNTSPTRNAKPKVKQIPKKGSNSKGCNIQVVVRLRGPNAKERAAKSLSVVYIPENSTKEIKIINEAYDRREPPFFRFDQVFGPQTSQMDLFGTVVSPILDEVLLGFNCTIFAYGQTGTGKTYTMEGDLTSEDGQLGYNAGIIPRTLHELFKRLGEDHNKYTVRLSMLELYNEEVGDLLSLGDNVPKLTLNIDASSKLQIHGMEEILIEDTASGIALLQSGSAKRHTAATNCNQKSSRSHCIFTITVRIKESNLEGQDLLKEGKLYLVDLAGSEDTKISGAMNQQAREAGLINQSLLSLGRVITNLVAREESNAPIHIPYRESKLTRILQDSLGGQTKTCIIATISPAKASLEETVSTLKYATKAMKITNTPVSNQKMTSSIQITDLKTEIATLRSKLQAAYDKNGIYLDKASHNDLLYKAQQGEGRVAELTQEIEALKATRKREAEMHQATAQSLANTKSQLEKVSQKLVLKSNECREKISQLLKTQHLLEEQRALKEAYCFTETKLDVVASNLVNGMNSRIGDICRLHEKIERKTSITENNKEKLRLLEKTVESEVDHLHGRLEAFKLEQETLSRDFKAILTALQNDLSEANARHSIDLAGKETTLTSSLVALDEALESYVNDSKACLDNLVSECESSHKSFANHRDDISIDLKSNLQTLSEKSRLYKEELNQHKDSLSLLIENFKAQLQVQLDEQCSKLQGFSDTITGQDSNQIQALKEQIRSLQSIITEYRQKEPDLIQLIKSTLSENLNKYSALGNRLREASETASEVLDHETARREKLTHENSVALEQCRDNLINLVEIQKDKSSLVIEHFDQTCGSSNRFVDETLVGCQLTQDKISAIQETFSEKVTSNFALQTEIVDKHQLKTNMVHLLKNDSIQALKSSVSNLCQDFRGNAYFQLDTANTHANNAILKATSMEERVLPFVAQCANIASTCKDQTHETISTKLQDDKSSGNTPKPKTKYSFPTEWERTDPEAAKVLFRQACPEPTSPSLDSSIGSIIVERTTRHDDSSRSSSRASSCSRSGIRKKRDRSSIGGSVVSSKSKMSKTASGLCSPEK